MRAEAKWIGYFLLVLSMCNATFAQDASNPTMLMVSDIHFNPFHDPAKLKDLEAAPAGRWEEILARGESSTQQQDFAALSTSCKLRGIDTPYSLFASAVNAMHQQAAEAKVITVTGDLLAHSFSCMFQKLDPNAGPEQYTIFTAKTMEYEMLQLRHAAPHSVLYYAIGNNDSDCGDYRLNHDEPWFRMLATTLAAGSGGAWDIAATKSFEHSGSYSIRMPAPMRHTRVISINDMYLSGGYKTCSGTADQEAATQEIAWLQKQLNAARKQHESVWIMGHLPIGVSPYATFLQQVKTMNLCTPNGKATTYLPTDLLDKTLEQNADVIKLALFGHTHVDEFKLVEGTGGHAFPLKITPAVTTIGGNLPSFTVAKIDAVTAQITDYTVYSAPDKEGSHFAKEYTYSEAYGRKSFNADSVRSIIVDLRKDTTLSTKISQNYVLNWSVGAMRNQIQPAWPGYVCGMDKMDSSDYKQCVCQSPLGPALGRLSH